MRNTRELLACSPGQPDYQPPVLVDGFEPVDTDPCWFCGTDTTRIDPDGTPSCCPSHDEP